MEEKLLDAEKFYERQEAEKKEAINKERIEKIRPYVEDVTGLDFSEMNDYDFEDYVLGKKTRFENEAKAKLEAEEKEAEDKRLNELAYERQMQIAPYAQFLNSDVLLREMSDEDYKELFFNLQAAKIEFDKVQEKIRPYVEDVIGLDFSEMNDYDFEDFVLGKKTRFENEAKAKLEAEEKAEAERIAEIERQKAIEAENAKLKAEAEAKEKELQKERAEAKVKQDAIELKAKLEANKQAELQAQKDAEIKKEREAREKLEADLKAKQDAELKAEQEAKKEAEKLAKAPIKKQLSVWVDSFELPNTNIDNEVSQEIKAKFEAFKKWSLTQVNNL